MTTSDTLVVNLFAGPGTGKSTNMALTFGKLKTQGIPAEQISEYAKDLVWEERHTALSFQPYLAAKQIYRVHRVLGKVPVVITDSPILLGLVYDDSLQGSKFEEFLLETFNSWNTFNIHLIRNNEAHPYVPIGRTQKDADEAREEDDKIEDLLGRHQIPHSLVHVDEGEITADKITSMVKERLNARE